MIINIVRKPLIGSVCENITLHNTGGINIDDTRIATEDGKPPYEYKRGAGGVETLSKNVDPKQCELGHLYSELELDIHTDKNGDQTFSVAYERNLIFELAQCGGRWRELAPIGPAQLGLDARFEGSAAAFGAPLPAVLLIVEALEEEQIRNLFDGIHGVG